MYRIYGVAMILNNRSGHRFDQKDHFRRTSVHCRTPSVPQPFVYILSLTARDGRSRLVWRRLCINNNNKNSKTMFIVLSAWQSHCESSPGSFDECRTAPSVRRPKTKPDDLGCESAGKLPESTPTVAIYYYYSARRVVGWVDLVSWLHTEMVYPHTDGHPSWY